MRRIYKNKKKTWIISGIVLALGMGLSLYVRRLGQRQEPVTPAA